MAAKPTTSRCMNSPWLRSLGRVLEANTRGRGYAATRPRCNACRSEYLDCALQRFVHAPSQRDGNERPEQRRLGVEPAFAYAERAMLESRLALGARRLQPGDFLSAHVPL